jgi:mRNA interferase RelE/StbE
MSYELVFLDEALKEWHTLNNNIRSQFKNILRERLNNPYMPSAKLIAKKDLYKIKLSNSPYRLCYEVQNNALIVFGITSY